jgi:O-antigen ligase
MHTHGSYIPLVFAMAFCGLVPLLHTHVLNDPVLYPQLLGMVAVGGLLTVLLLRQGTSPVTVPMQPAWALAALGLLAGLSSTWALNPAEAWFVAARWLLALGFLILSQIVLGQWPQTLLLMCKVLVVSMSGFALIGILQSLGIDPLALSDTFHSPTGLQANRNFFGSAMLLGIPFASYASFQSKGAWKIASIAAIGLMVAGIFVAGTRAAFVPLILGILLFPPILIWRHRQGRSRLAAMLLWLLVAAVGVWSSQFVLPKKNAKINWDLLWTDGQPVTPQSSSLDFRLISWHQTLILAQEKPLLGHGAGNWKMHIQRLGLQSFDDKGNFGMVVPLHPHNEFLAMFAELGVPGLLLLLTAWGIGIWSALRMLRNRNGQHDEILGACLLLGWLALTIDASFSFPLERPLHLMIFCLLLALSAQGLPSKTGSPSQVKVGLSVALTLFILAGLDIGARTLADSQIRLLRAAKEAQRPEKVLKLAPHATNWATQLDPVAALSIDWYVAMAQIESGQQAAAMQAIERSALVSPHHLAQRAGRASLLDLTGRYVEAIAAQTTLLETFPNFSEGKVNLSIMQIHAGRLIEARATLNEVPRADVPALYDKVDAALKDTEH